MSLRLNRLFSGTWKYIFDLCTWRSISNGWELDLCYLETKVACALPFISTWCIGSLPHMNRALQWRHNERDGASNHQPHDCLLNRLFRHRSKKMSKLCVNGPCEGNSPVTGEFHAQRANKAENVSIWWCHHGHNWITYNKGVRTVLLQIIYTMEQSALRTWTVHACSYDSQRQIVCKPGILGNATRKLFYTNFDDIYWYQPP